MSAAMMLAPTIVAAPARAAGPFTVNTTNDTHDTTNDGSCADSNGQCSLRAALEQANSSGGTTTINLPSGIYDLSLNDALGSDDLFVGTAANTNITIHGTGTAANTTINQTKSGRLVFNVNPNVVPNVVFELDHVTVTGGNENELDPDGFGGNGGAILAGGSSTATGNAVTLANDVFSGNYCSPSVNAGCSGGAVNMTGGGNLTVSNSTFSGNTASKNSGFGGGGAIYFDNGANGGDVSITNSTFANNTAQGNSTTGGQGGAVRLAGGAGSTYTVDNNTFTGNAANGTAAAGAHGGALYLSLGSLTANFNRIVGNTAEDSSGLYVANNTGSIGTATNNWWGCNAGPSTAHCDTAVLGTPNQGGSMTVSPWITLKTTASPSSINYGSSTTLTSSFLQNSSGVALTASNVSQLIGLPVTWANTAHGTLSSQQTSIGSSGTATSTFTAGSTSADCGNVGTSEATVDNVPSGDTTATASVAITCPDLTATLTNNVSGASILGSSWTWTLTGTNGGAGTASYSNGQTILTDNLPASNVSYGSVSEQNVSGITGTISCSINGSDDLTCTANGSVTIAAGGSFTAGFSATPSAGGSFVNPRGAGACAIDPNNTVPETSDANNACSDTVTVTAPDLTVTTSDNVSGADALGNSWTWTAHIANASASAAGTFTSGETILTDQLDNSGAVSYGTPTVGNGTSITNIGNISCSISASTLTCTATGPVMIGASGSLDIGFTASASSPGTYANPRSAGTCAVDPNNVVPESNDANNSCPIDSVTVSAADLTATKTDNVGHATTLGTGWTWTIAVANVGAAPATFQSGQTIVTDDLPSSGLGYGTVVVSNLSGITGTGAVVCGINASTLSCTASAGTVTIAAGTGGFDAGFTATPTTTGTFANPRAGGACSVDPGSVVTESDETNNSCSDTVAVTAPDLTETVADNAGGPVLAGHAFNWTLTTANLGRADAVFTAGATILRVDLDGSGGVTYGSPSIAHVTNVTGAASIACAINGSSTLTCAANSGAVTIGPTTGSFDVVVPTTVVQGGQYTVPRAGGVCRADPSSTLIESNTSNNDCQPDTVSGMSPTDLSTTDAGSPQPSVTAGSNGGVDNLTHVITLHNGGTTTVAADVAVSFPGGIPSGTTLHTATPSAGSYNGATRVWSVPSLASGASETLTLSFNVGVATANTATIQSSAAASVTTPDTADTSPGNNDSSQTTTVLTPPAVSPDPRSWDFGAQRVGVATSAKTFTITNTGGEDLTITADAISGSGAGDFSRASEDCTTRSPIAPGHSCSISVAFLPTAAGGQGNAAIHIVSDDPAGPTDIALQGMGTRAAVTASPSVKDFGAQRVGTTSATQAFTITNTGTDTLHVSGISVTGTDASQFATSADTCSGHSVDVGHSCTIGVAFRPTAVARAAASMRIISDVGQATIGLAGTGTRVEPSNTFRVSHIRVLRNGVVTLSIAVPGPGRIDVLETAWDHDEARTAAVLLQPAPHRFVFARGLAAARVGGVLRLRIVPNGRGRRLVAHHRFAVRIRLWVTFTPVGGTRSKQGFLGLFVTR